MSENNEYNDNIELFGGDDFIYSAGTGENGEPQIMAGGFKVGSYFLDAGIPAITTLNQEHQAGGSDKVSSPFEYLVVPAGIFYANPQNTKKENEKNIHYTNHETISDDLYDNLFALIQGKPNKKKKTRRHPIDLSSKKKKTRKHL